jgi:hypothetical protein
VSEEENTNFAKGRNSFDAKIDGTGQVHGRPYMDGNNLKEKYVN